MAPFLGKPCAGVSETSHHATDTAHREAVLLPLLIRLSSSETTESPHPHNRECLPTSRPVPGPRHTRNVLSCFQPSSQTHLGCLFLPIPSNPSAPPHQCWTPRSGHRLATKLQIPKKGQTAALAVVHPKEQMLLLPRNPTYLPYLPSRGSDTPQAPWLFPHP